METSDQYIPDVAPPFTISSALSKSWKLVPGSKGTYFAALGICIAIGLGFLIVRALIVDFGNNVHPGLIEIGFNLVQQVVSYALGAGIMLISIRRARGEFIRATMVFDGFDRLGPLILLLIMMGLAVLLGMILLILPGIYLAVAYSFAVPLCIDKGLGPWEAMEVSRKLVTSRWFTYFFTYFLCGIITIISALPFGIGLIWTIPMTYNLIGSLYVEAFNRSK